MKVKMKLDKKERKAGLDLRNFTIVPIKGAANRRRMGGAAMLVPKQPEKPQIIPKLNKRDIQLCYDGIGFWLSDYNDAPHIEIEKLRQKLLKMGAKK